MAAGFREIEGVTADVGLESWGTDLPEAVEQMTLGLSSLMTENPGQAEGGSVEVEVQADEMGALIVRYLNEVIFLFDTRGFVPSGVRTLRIGEGRLTAVLDGGALDPARHVRGSSVKAATYHGLTVQEDPGMVKLRVIFDV